MWFLFCFFCSCLTGVTLQLFYALYAEILKAKDCEKACVQGTVICANCPRNTFFVFLFILSCQHLTWLETLKTSKYLSPSESNLIINNPNRDWCPVSWSSPGYINMLHVSTLMDKQGRKLFCLFCFVFRWSIFRKSHEPIFPGICGCKMLKVHVAWKG